ncbi:MAG TPA: hypothetical protein PLN69_02840 [bacterium]|nr:hypothetical protein [bacterium]
MFAENNSEADSAWAQSIDSLSPFSMNLTVFVGDEDGYMKKTAVINVDFPDNERFFQAADIYSIMELHYLLYSDGKFSLMHEVDSEAVTYFPTGLSPVSIYSLQCMAESALNKIKYEAASAITIDNGSRITMKISIEPIIPAKGIMIRELKGNIELEAKSKKPMNLIVSGIIDMNDNQNKPISFSVDFQYDKPWLTAEGWKVVEKAFNSFSSGDRANGEKQIKSVARMLMRPLGLE